MAAGTTSPLNQAPATPTPGWSVLAFTFINSLGTGVVTSGIFFLAKQGYGFSDIANFALGVLLGVTYIVGALAAGPGLRWLRRVMPRVGTRGVLVALMLALAALCAVPWLAEVLAAREPGSPRAQWPIWLIVALYSPLTGLLWPIVESYLSGGLSGGPLRRAIGWWNVVWSSALVVAYWLVAPFIAEQPALAVLALGVVHVVAGVLVVGTFSREPSPHVEGEHEPHPPVYRALLATFRVLLPASYVVSSALGPYLASIMPALGVAAAWQTVVASAWLIPRCAAFAWLGFWPGWHGRWWPVAVGASCLLGGFGGCVAAGMLAGGPWALPVLLAGLAVFGAGMGMIYCGAIYYAMEVGKAQVDAGGTHEALIGVGFTIGPACGLAAQAAMGAGWIGARGFHLAVLSAVGLIAVVACVVAVAQVVKVRRSA